MLACMQACGQSPCIRNRIQIHASSHVTMHARTVHKSLLLPPLDSWLCTHLLAAPPTSGYLTTCSVLHAYASACPGLLCCVAHDTTCPNRKARVPCLSTCSTIVHNICNLVIWNKPSPSTCWVLCGFRHHRCCSTLSLQCNPDHDQPPINLIASRSRHLYPWCLSTAPSNLAATSDHIYGP